MTLAFWFSVVPATAGAITQDAGRELPMICAGVFIGTLSWVCCFAGMLSYAGKRRRNWWLSTADGAGGIVLLGFAARSLWHAYRSSV